MTNKTTKTGRLLTIVNWEKYQDNNKEATKITTKKRPRSDQEAPPNKSDKNDNNDKDTNTKDFFEQLWKDYPRRLGKKEALRHFNASVESEKDRQDIRKALNNYLTTDNVVNKTKYVLHGSTWFNNWRDWVEYTRERTGNESCQEYKNEHPVILFPTITEEQRLENIKNIKAIINKIGNLPEEPVGTNLNRRKKCQ